jgi:channel protein (hemolysin III family)
LEIIINTVRLSSNFFTNSRLSNEETANAYTHAIGGLLFLLGCVALIVKAYMSGNVLKIFSAYVYGFSLVLLYGASTSYHTTTDPKTKALLQKLDHSAIFILIAGTYTPFLLVALYNYIDISFFITMWSIAMFGVVYKLLAIKKIKLLSTAIYLAMGWMAVLKSRLFTLICPFRRQFGCWPEGFFTALALFFIQWNVCLITMQFGIYLCFVAVLATLLPYIFMYFSLCR